MPQGKGTYGSEVGRPSKKDKNKSSGDDMYGVGKDIEKMNTSNAQDRVQKYAVGGDVEPTKKYALAGPVYADIWNEVEGFGDVRPWDLANQTSDVYDEIMTRNERTTDEAQDRYKQGLYGGTTSYDAASAVAMEKGDQFGGSSGSVTDDGDDDDGGGLDGGYPNPFNSPGQSPDEGGPPLEDNRDVQLRDGGGIKQELGWDRGAGRRLEEGGIAQPLGWDRGSGRRLAEGGEIPDNDVEISGSLGDVEFGPGGPGGYVGSEPSEQFGTPEGGKTSKESLVTGEGTQDIDLEGRNVYTFGGSIDARSRRKGKK